MADPVFVRILNIGALIRDYLFFMMYFHCILASAITLYVFAVPFNFITTTSVAHVAKIRHPVPVCRTNGQAGAFLSFSNSKLNIEDFGSIKLGFSKHAMLKSDFAF